MPNTINAREEKDDCLEILEVAFEEQRRFHDELTDSFKALRNKIIYFIGAELAFITFLYSGAIGSEQSIQKRLFIPNELYGIIFYFFGLFCLLYALFVLIRGARPNAIWHVPSDELERHVLGKVKKGLKKEDFLQKIVDEYEDSSKQNLIVHAEKSNALKDSFFPLLLGAIILVVLRFFQ